MDSYRKSNTEPIIRIFAEAKTQEEVNELINTLKNYLNEVIEKNTTLQILRVSGISTGLKKYFQVRNLKTIIRL